MYHSFFFFFILWKIWNHGRECVFHMQQSGICKTLQVFNLKRKKEFFTEVCFSTVYLPISAEFSISWIFICSLVRKSVKRYEGTVICTDTFDFYKIFYIFCRVLFSFYFFPRCFRLRSPRRTAKLFMNRQTVICAFDWISLTLNTYCFISLAKSLFLTEINC